MESLSRHISCRRVKFWNPIMITAFSGSLLLFSRAFLSSRPHDHLVSLNLTKSYEADHFDLTSNLSTVNVKPVVIHKVSLPISDPVDTIKNGTSDMPQISLESDLLGEESSQATTPPLTPMTGSKVLNWAIYRSFSSRLLSNPRAQLRTSRLDHNDVAGENIDNNYHSEARRLIDPGYDPLEQEPFFSKESSDRLEEQIFALKIWLDPKEFSRTKIGKGETCQASGGIKCWPDSQTNYAV